jgi:hypothetical protein
VSAEALFQKLRAALEAAEIPYMIAKLEWSKMGESERQIRDAAGIIQVQGSALDVSYVEHWVAELQLEREWKWHEPKRVERAFSGPRTAALEGVAERDHVAERLLVLGFPVAVEADDAAVQLVGDVEA